MNKNIYLLQIFVAMLIYIFFWNSIILAPLKIYMTAIHETFHGLAAFLTGGSIYKMSLDHFSGTLTSSGGFYPIISVAGYLGSALLGALLISTKNKVFLLAAQLIVVSLVSVIYIDNLISYEFIGLAIILGLLFFAVMKNFYLDNIAFFIGTMLAIESVQDIKMYLFIAPGETDSGLLANWIGLDILTLPISIFMFLASMAIWYYFGLKRFFKNH